MYILKYVHTCVHKYIYFVGLKCQKFLGVLKVQSLTKLIHSATEESSKIAMLVTLLLCHQKKCQLLEIISDLEIRA
jgi:hypothetical protein